jgi:endonuclease YncB( thermonuclease family)
MKAYLIGLLLACTLLLPATAQDIIGRASVIDGDTIEIRGERIRLAAIDAPESSQLCQDTSGRDYRCGQQAALALSDMIGAQNVSCRPDDRDRYGRTIATCFLRDLDLNGWMVEQGHALAYLQYGGARYSGAEAAARGEGRGMWAGTFVPPWDWRRGVRTPAGIAAYARQEQPSRADCRIKGNISKNGRIYHVPGSRHYDRTRIDTSRGERWFCSEEEARRAGWRAPRG